jgi:hypothetical protein
MERMRRTVVQLEEVKRFILDGEFAHLRLALILLSSPALTIRTWSLTRPDRASAAVDIVNATESTGK